jgi:hypothetical protein
MTDITGPMVTAFMPLPKRSVLLVLFGKCVCWHGLDNMDKDGSTLPLKGAQILDVLSVDETDKHYLFIGREKSHNGMIKALYAEIKTIKPDDDEIHFNHVLNLECDSWISGVDAACTLVDADGNNDGKIFLLAQVKGSGLLRQIGRPGISRR